MFVAFLSLAALAAPTTPKGMSAPVAQEVVAEQGPPPPPESPPFDPAVLGPDGPLWLGPLPPGPQQAPVILVDPRDGTLYVRDDVRTWSHGQWSRGGRALEPGDPTLVWDEAGRLEASVSDRKSRRRFLYDADGRLVGVLTSEGTTIQVRYDAGDRVAEIVGPGILRWTFKSGEEGLRAVDTVGRVWMVSTDASGGVLTRDPVSRVARMAWDGEGRLKVFTDPVGGETTLQWKGDDVEVRTRSGRTLRISLGPDRRPRAIDAGDGQRWHWSYDDRGRLLTITDPVGRTTEWVRSAGGHVVEVRTGRRRVALERDTEGRLLRVTDATGAGLRVVRDLDGRLVGLEDATGGRVSILGAEAAWPDEVTTRRGGQVSFGFDLLGHVSDVVDPVGGRIALLRDGAARLEGIVDSIFGEVRIDRALDGRITRVVGPDGRALGLVRDLSGAVSELRRPDGTSLVLERSPLGEVESIRQGETEIRIRRDVEGRPLEVGPVQWAWDPSGTVSTVTYGPVVLRLERDAAGLVRRVSAGSFTLSVDRDLAGLILRWSGSDGAVSTGRDAQGRVTSELVTGPLAEARKLTVVRDPRGWIDRIDVGERAWRIDREPGGGALRVQGPSSLRIGQDVDALGRLTLVRYPSGLLARYDYRDRTVLEAIETADGVPIQALAYELDTRGRPVSAVDTDGNATVWRYGPLGEIVAIEGPDGAWSWTPDGFRGPGGLVLVSDESGRMAEARPPAWPHAWSIAEEMLSVRRDPWGRMTEVTGELGTVELSYDALGRLSEVRPPEGGAWKVGYDARGRWCRLRTPDDLDATFVWGPDGELLLTGERAWIGAALGPIAMTQADHTAEIVRDRWGDPIALGLDGQALVPHRISPTGFPSSDASGILGPKELLQLFPGGPLIGDSVALDAVSGQRVDGWTGWPWSPRQVRSATDNDHLDPTPWLPTSAWSDPLGILVDLGIVRPPTDEPTVRLGVDEPLLHGLPVGLAGGRPPLGPGMDAVALGLGPVADMVAARMLRGDGEIDPDDFVGLLIQDEVGVDWLPPGVEVPGLERWRKVTSRLDQITGRED